MSKAKHTPAPWPYEGGDDAGVDIILPNNTTITVGRACRYTNKYVISRDEMEANARLIAASPEMYEMLKSCLAFVDVLDLHGIVDNWSDRPKLIELIKKIEG